MKREAKKCKQCGKKIYFDGICISCRAENERSRILALTTAEIDAAVERICDDIERTGQLDEELFRKLLNFRDIDTAKIAAAAFEKNLFYPCELYKNTPENIKKAMLEMLMEDDIEAGLAGNLLLCLAVCGGKEVFHAFLELEQHPRKWRNQLYADLSMYAVYGGWSYDSAGRYRKTNFDRCYPMVKGTLEEKKKSPVKIGVKTEGKCPNCGCSIVNLMEIDGRDFRLGFLGIDGRIKAKCCPNCVSFSDGDYCRYTIDGESELVFGEEHFTSEDYLGEEGVEELEENTYILGDKSVPLRYAADWEGGSCVGGFAFWIQDCEIKLCPDCKKPMRYLAQIQWDTVLDGMEGNAYLEICKECRVIAIIHQQT